MSAGQFALGKVLVEEPELRPEARRLSWDDAFSA